VEHLAGVVAPGPGFCGVAELDARRPIPVEGGGAFLLDPTTVDHDAIIDQHWLARAPRRLLDSAFSVEPSRGRLVDEVAVLIALRLPAFSEHLSFRQACIDTGADPDLAARREYVEMLGQVGDKIVDGHPAARRIRSRSRGRECLLSHVVHSDIIRSLKSKPGSSGVSWITLRLARSQRPAQ